MFRSSFISRKELLFHFLRFSVMNRCVVHRSFCYNLIINITPVALPSSCFYSFSCLSINQFLSQVVRITPTIKWAPEDVTIGNTVGSLILFYAFYDLIYMTFHRILHMRQFYSKHVCFINGFFNKVIYFDESIICPY